MSDEPAFPKPPPRPSVYRAPAAGASQEPARRSPVVVTRPEPPSEAPEPARPRDRAPVPIHAERMFWQRQRFMVRHPRLSALVLLLLGAFALAPSVAAKLEHVHVRGGRLSLFGTIALATGAWLLVAGAAPGPDGRLPRWWRVGLVAVAALAALVDLALFT